MAEHRGGAGDKQETEELVSRGKYKFVAISNHLNLFPALYHYCINRLHLLRLLRDVRFPPLGWYPVILLLAPLLLMNDKVLICCRCASFHAGYVQRNGERERGWVSILFLKEQG